MVLELALLPFVLFLPGYLFLNLIFPRPRSLGGEVDLLYRLFLGVVLSLAFVLLYGTALVLLGSGGEEVFFRPAVLWPGLIGLSAVLFVGGFLRGAYPALHRWLGGRAVAPQEPLAAATARYERLVELTSRIEDLRRRQSAQPDQRQALQAEVEGLERERSRLEREGAEE